MFIIVQDSEAETISGSGDTDTIMGNSYHIYQHKDSEWEEIYVEPFTTQYSTKTFPVQSNEGKVTLRIVQRNMPFGDVEQIRLVANGKELTPGYASYTDNGESVLEDILYDDLNVIVAHERPIEISWNCPSEEAVLYLKANEYDHGYPLSFPKYSSVPYRNSAI